MGTELERQITKSKKPFFSFRIATIWNGLKTSVVNEFSIHLIIGGMIVTIGLAFFLGCNMMEWAFLIFMLGVMFGIELFNTAIENIVDLKSPNYHPLAKIAKDTASAAEGIFAMLTFLSIGLILIPKMIEFIMW